MTFLRNRLSRPLYLIVVAAAMAAWTWGLAMGLQRLLGGI